MNDNNLNNNFNNNDNNVGTYHATTNLNTAIENPQMNVNSVTGINIKDLEYSSYADNGMNDAPNNMSNNQSVNSNSMNNSFSNNVDFVDNNYNINQNNVGLNVENNNFVTEKNLDNSDDNTINNDYQVYSSQNNTNYSYQPVMKEKKRADDNALSNLIHSKEFKVMVFIIFVLVLFILVMPYIYDFFRELTMRGTA